jgi:two-component system, sensor histidine kinase and response regulator
MRYATIRGYLQHFHGRIKREQSMTKILVIDDEATVRDELVAWLSDEGYEAFGISESQASVEYLLFNRVDLIVYDITQPLIDGYGPWLEVHAHLAAAQIPFVFVAAGSSQEDIRKGMALGTEYYITKPFDRRDLLQAVHTRLETGAAQDQKRRRDVEILQSALAAEREQRMLNAKMIAMFSHDFRNPLTIILTTSQLLRSYSDRMDEPRRLLHMARIEAAGKQLLQMLEDVLVIAQMDAGKLDFNPEPLPIAQFLAQIVEEFQVLHIPTHHLLFENHFTPTTIPADSRLLRQIAVNLISNAIKYTPPGREIRVLLDGDENGDEHGDENREAGQQCVLTVQDQGIGIREEDWERVFAPYERGTNVGNVSGTGLGLAIVKQAVNLHGGTIQIESHNDRGTTIRVAIPYR